MPTYDYSCQACGHDFEAFQSMTAAPLRKCPVCGKLQLKRLIGMGAGVIFKGSGFYETDYRSDGYKQSAKAEKEDKKAAKEKSTTDAGKKPSAKSADSKYTKSAAKEKN